MKPLILFDIDNTLLDTSFFVSLFIKEAATLLHSDETHVRSLLEAYKNSLVRYSDFSPNDFVQFIAGQEKISVEKIQESFWDPTHYQKALFPEVKEVFKSLSEKYTLGTFSEGFEKYQKYKIESNELLPFFDPKYTYILRRKMDPDTIKKLPENTVIIDDRSDVIEFLQQFPNIRTFHIVRNAEKRNSSQISSLRDLLTLL